MRPWGYSKGNANSHRLAVSRASQALGFLFDTSLFCDWYTVNSFTMVTEFIHSALSILWVLIIWDSLFTEPMRCQVRSCICRVSRGECDRLRENVPYVKVHRYNPKHLYPKLKGYGDNGERKVWSSCGSAYCTCFACCYPYTVHVRPSVSQPSQAHSAFIINRCHSYSEL